MKGKKGIENQKRCFYEFVTIVTIQYNYILHTMHYFYL